ncbi:MAG: hypothetical protein FJX77_05815 [Armatimonadetes bacterium]|nr:hypothetical protein [Armatimonadota bacterium]
MLVDIIFATTIFAFAILAWGALYPIASQTARRTADYTQAVSALQHKADQLRAVGFGRLTYTELLNAGIIDAAPNSSPFRFEVADGLSSHLWSPVGAITISNPASDLRQVDLSLTWQVSPTRQSTHALTILIAQE